MLVGIVEKCLFIIDQFSKYVNVETIDLLRVVKVLAQGVYDKID